MLPPIPIPLGPGPGGPPGRRASDADRDTAVDILCAAVGDGRLSLAELDERVGAALSARTLPELAALIADLSGPWPPSRRPASGPPVSGRTARDARPAPPGWMSRAADRWAVLQSLAVPVTQ